MLSRSKRHIAEHLLPDARERLAEFRVQCLVWFPDKKVSFINEY